MERPSVPQAVVTDLDGTIVRRDGSVSPATLAAAAELRERGVPLVAVTARTPAGVRALGQLQPHLTLAVCCTGAMGWSPGTGEVLWQDNLAGAAVRTIIGLVREHLPEAGASGYDGRSWALTGGYVAARGKAPNGPYEVVPAAEIAERPACALAVCDPGRHAQDVAGLLVSAGVTAEHATLSYANPRIVDIAPPRTDKFTGASRALGLLGIEPASTIAFGDMPNDVPLFRLGGQAVAVGNAHPELLAAATAVTASVDDDGFARHLTRLGVI
ncbi:HAD family hydrolase [Longispora albida]|uniref:HAD family hydrolase n=1 Tax=Longispora albida TaxID=203523 RepID=UPI00035D2B07|nr:HAD family hydrolase [Longispora albida]